MAVTDEAIERIKDMIARGEVRAGDRLPNEEVFADRLGLSRNSLREAVRALSAMGILVSRHGDGTYVSSLEPHLLLQSLAFAAEVSSAQDALHMLEVRRMLEPQATALAAARITESQLTELRDCLDRGTGDVELSELIELDMEFHRRIIAVADNPVLSLLLDVLAGRTAGDRVVRGSRVADARGLVRREHDAILRALAARDPQLAAAAAAAHVHGLEEWVATQGKTSDQSE